ncbi:MAG: hypothetical protein RJB01_160 [Actinomycetota bacterium]|jgi:AcrR family transcriptional regulator
MAPSDSLLDAAQVVLDRRGYHGASFEEVAECAGVSEFEVQEAFGTPEAMFLATVDRFLVGQMAKYDDDVTAVTWEEAAYSYGLKVAKARLEPSIASWDRVLIEFWIVASREATIRDEVRKRNTANLDRAGAILRDFLARFDRDAVVVPRELARGVFALGRGMGLERTMDDDWDPDELALMVAAYLEGMSTQR